MLQGLKNFDFPQKPITAIYFWLLNGTEAIIRDYRRQNRWLIRVQKPKIPGTRNVLTHSRGLFKCVCSCSRFRYCGTGLWKKNFRIAHYFRIPVHFISRCRSHQSGVKEIWTTQTGQFFYFTDFCNGLLFISKCIHRIFSKYRLRGVDETGCTENRCQ